MASSLQLQIAALQALLASRKQIIRVFVTVADANADARFGRQGNVLRIVTGVARGYDD